MILLEKAYAKAYGGYNNIGQGGQGHYALFDLTGAPSEALKIEREVDYLFELLYSYDLREFVMTCGSRDFTDEELSRYSQRKNFLQQKTIRREALDLEEVEELKRFNTRTANEKKFKNGLYAGHA